MPKHQNQEEDEDKSNQYAFDTNGDWVNATKTVYKRHSVFTCGCPDRHSAKLVKPSGLPEKRPFCDYFAHITQPKRQKSSEHPAKISCSPGGESAEHKKAKHTLRELAGSYYFTTFICICCRGEVIRDSVNCTVSMEIVSADRRWRYDCLLKENDKAVAAMEVVHTHITGSAKINSVRESGLEIVEFRAEDVLAMATNNVRTKLENIKIRSGICDNCTMMAPYNMEMLERLKLDSLIFNGYVQQDKLQKHAQEELRTRREQEERKQINEKEERQKCQEQEEMQKNLRLMQERKKLEQGPMIEEITPNPEEGGNNTPANQNRAIDSRQKLQTQSIYDPPRLIYTSVYHAPDGKPSWTPYEMIAHLGQ
jgi:hypothetical protein